MISSKSTYSAKIAQFVKIKLKTAQFAAFPMQNRPVRHCVLPKGRLLARWLKKHQLHSLSIKTRRRNS